MHLQGIAQPASNLNTAKPPKGTSRERKRGACAAYGYSHKATEGAGRGAWLCRPRAASVVWSLVRKLLQSTWSCSNSAWRLAKLQTPQETMVTAAVWGRTLREGRLNLGLPEWMCKDSVSGCRDTSGRGLGITAPPLMEVKPSAPSGFILSLFSVTWCSDTSKDLGLCMDHESTHKAYAASRPGRSVSDGSGAPWKYSHLCTVEYLLNSFLCVLKQITITRIITTVV